MFQSPESSTKTSTPIRNVFTVILLLALLVCGQMALSTSRSPSNPPMTPTSAISPDATPAVAITPTATATRIATPTATAASIPTATATPTPTATIPPPPLPTNTALPAPPTITPPPPFIPEPPAGREFASLDEFWAGSAEWVLEEYDVGLPVGESDTIHRGGTEFWSYLHASHQSAGVVDQCGAPAPFPGCLTLWKSYDGGRHFALEEPTCLIPCVSCPCNSVRDHIDQQQYPRVFFDTDRAYMVYEWGGATFLRTSSDGIRWTAASQVPWTGVWFAEQGPCAEFESVGEHPHIWSELEYDCLIGAPPGIYVEGDILYVFVGLGRAPGHMGCYLGNKYSGAGGLYRCPSNPLFGAELGYGPIELTGAEANPYFEYRTISSADVVRVGDRYYMTYEGVRGPSRYDVVDDQFGLGFARSLGLAIDGPWERYPGNPMIMDLSGNWGVGHADLLIVGPATYMYTATSANTRGRYVLVRK